MITIKQSTTADIQLDEAPASGIVYLQSNGSYTEIEYEALPALIETLQNYLKAS
jgi:hypothetical protein